MTDHTDQTNMLKINRINVNNENLSTELKLFCTQFILEIVLRKVLDFLVEPWMNLISTSSIDYK